MEKKILEIASEVLGLDISTLDLNFSRDNTEIWSSLLHVALVATIEERLNLSVPFEEIAGIKKLGDFLKYND